MFFRAFSAVGAGTYIVSGFGKASGQVAGPLGRFALRVDVCYYDEYSMQTEVETHYFDFSKSCHDWQFVSGTLKIEERPKQVLWLDIICEYSGQPNGEALFDNIAFYKDTAEQNVEYDYYLPIEVSAEELENMTDEEKALLDAKNEKIQNRLGLLRAKFADNAEYYEYDDARRLIRITNNRQQMTEYYYTAGGNTVAAEATYTYSPRNYPYLHLDPVTQVTRTPETLTQYTYNSYGQLLTTCTTGAVFADDPTGEELPVDPLVDATHPQMTVTRTYETAEKPRIIGALKSETDGTGVTTRYFYDSNNGRLLSSLAGDSGSYYSYDAVGRLIAERPAVKTIWNGYSAQYGVQLTGYTYNSKGWLTGITTESTAYTMTYDAFGNTTGIKAGGVTLATYSYAANNGKMLTLQYGNGVNMRYEYDDRGNVAAVWYQHNGGLETRSYAYTYTAAGQLRRVDNLLTGKSTVYQYDTAGRMTRFVEFDTDELVNEFSGSALYNDEGSLASMHYRIDYAYAGNGFANWSYGSNYSYNNEGELTRQTIRGDGTLGRIDYTYDDYGRPTGQVTTATGSGATFSQNIAYQYSTAADKYIQIQSYTSTVNGNAKTTTYTYDSRGNITKMVVDGIEHRLLYRVLTIAVQ